MAQRRLILLTGATGTVGSALVPKLVEAGETVRCLVRDPRRLGPNRVRVQIAIGDLSDPASFRNALRGVDTVVHLAAAIRDQRRATIEELNGLATLRMLRAAERAGVEHFTFFSALDANLHSPSRFFRSKALAEREVAASGLRTTTFAPSIVYAPGDPWLTLLRSLSVFPVMPVAGQANALYQPIWAGDVADCVIAGLDRDGPADARFELAGPDTLSHEQIIRVALRAFGRPRRLANVPLTVVRQGLRAVERVLGAEAFATWDEAELMEIAMVSERGTADAEALGVKPLPMSTVLGAARPSV